MLIISHVLICLPRANSYSVRTRPIACFKAASAASEENNAGPGVTYVYKHDSCTIPQILYCTWMEYNYLSEIVSSIII